MRYRRVKMQDLVVVVPTPYRVVKETIVPNNKHPCIVAEKNNTLPYFALLWDKPVEEMTEADEQEIFRLCAKICPKVNKVLEEEVMAVYDKNGKIKNINEWCKSPRLGIFGITDIKSEVENLKKLKQQL